MASTRIAYRNPELPQSENLPPLRRPASPEHSRQAMLPALVFEKGRVKWSSAKKNFCYLTMDDGRDVFLHRDDFDGEWPPSYYKAIKFELIETAHKTCPRRAKLAERMGSQG
jgi:hypothetical protein